MMIMKNLKIKLGLFSLLAILAASVFLTSCEQDRIVPENQGYDINNIKASNFENSPENFDIDVYIKKHTHFSKTIAITNSAKKKFGVMELGIRVKSNDKRVLDRFDEDAVVFKYNETDNNPATEEHTGLDEKSTVKVPKLNKDTKVIQIEILGIKGDDLYKKDEYTGYTLEFSDEIKSLMNKENTLLSLDLMSSYKQPKNSKYFYPYSLYGDGATIHASAGSQAWYYYSNCNGWCPSYPMYYHSYKYFTDYWPSGGQEKDLVAVCCLYNCNNKSLRRMDFYGWGYVSSISINNWVCDAYGCGSSCHYG